MVQIENHFSRGFFVHHFFGRGPHFRLDAPAADRARDRTIFTDEHARAFVARNRAVRVHNRGQRSAQPRAPHFYDFFEQVHARPPPSAYGASLVVSMYGPGLHAVRIHSNDDSLSSHSTSFIKLHTYADYGSI